MKLANEFTVHVPIEQAWKVLTDLEGIAPCLPGAQLTGVDGDVYKGKVKVKVGPVISEFAGTAQFAEKDDAAYRGVIDAKGRDARSAGNAAALITAQLRADGDSTVVNVDTDLKISGKLAQFGSGMIKEVSQKLLGQFVTSLEAKIAADNGAPAARPDAPTATPDAPTAAPDAPTAAPDAPTAAAAATAQPEAAAAATTQPAAPAGTDAAEPAAAAGGTADQAPDAPLNGTVSAPGTPLLPPSNAGPVAAVEEPAPVQKNGFEAPEPAPLDLMALAGGSIRKRLIPVAIGVVVIVAAIVIWRIAR
jgi:carbon monoxide dehydrogenase subunit G